jgi:hypothetical protein
MTPVNREPPLLVLLNPVPDARGRHRGNRGVDRTRNERVLKAATWCGALVRDLFGLHSG